MRSKPCRAWRESWETRDRERKESSPRRPRQDSEARWWIDTMHAAESAPYERATRRRADLLPLPPREAELNWRRSVRPFRKTRVSASFLLSGGCKCVRDNLGILRGSATRIDSGNSDARTNVAQFIPPKESRMPCRAKIGTAADLRATQPRTQP